VRPALLWSFSGSETQPSQGFKNICLRTWDCTSLICILDPDDEFTIVVFGEEIVE
jgi:hypothetical protein